MDDYPSHLSTHTDPCETEILPFRVWWKEAQKHFLNVPECVAEQWLHRHWLNSPFGFLRSKDYRFELIAFPTNRLDEILSRQTDYLPLTKDQLDLGRYFCESDHPLPTLMRSLQNFPAPIIVLDNMDGHLDSQKPAYFDRIPPGLILIEGHKRLDIALYLSSIGKFTAVVKLWVMHQLRPADS